jgi:hypothetical protein
MNTAITTTGPITTQAEDKTREPLGTFYVIGYEDRQIPVGWTITDAQLTEHGRGWSDGLKAREAKTRTYLAIGAAALVLAFLMFRK